MYKKGVDLFSLLPEKIPIIRGRLLRDLEWEESGLHSSTYFGEWKLILSVSKIEFRDFLESNKEIRVKDLIEKYEKYFSIKR